MNENAEKDGLDSTSEFEQLRPVLLGLAYRLLGSMWDAEDIVQDAYLRWLRIDRTTVRDSRPYLMTTVSRLALDLLSSARVRREAYPGPWLPEPVPTGALGPMDTVELRDTVSYATVHMLQRLSPPERAVFVLREAFELPYEDIAGVVGASVAACRQMHHRARARLSEGRDRFRPSASDHARLLVTFLAAAQNGDLSGLTKLLSDDVVAWVDGGGRVRAALRPINGRERVVAFLTGLVSRYPIGSTRMVGVNGEPALLLSVDGQEQLVAVGLRNGLIDSIFAVMNPDKLARLRTPEPGSDLAAGH